MFAHELLPWMALIRLLTKFSRSTSLHYRLASYNLAVICVGRDKDDVGDCHYWPACFFPWETGPLALSAVQMISQRPSTIFASSGNCNFVSMAVRTPTISVIAFFEIKPFPTRHIFGAETVFNLTLNILWTTFSALQVMMDFRALNRTNLLGPCLYKGTSLWLISLLIVFSVFKETRFSMFSFRFYKVSLFMDESGYLTSLTEFHSRFIVAFTGMSLVSSVLLSPLIFFIYPITDYLKRRSLSPTWYFTLENQNWNWTWVLVATITIAIAGSSKQTLPFVAFQYWNSVKPEIIYELPWKPSEDQSKTLLSRILTYLWFHFFPVLSLKQFDSSIEIKGNLRNICEFPRIIEGKIWLDAAEGDPTRLYSTKFPEFPINRLNLLSPMNGIEGFARFRALRFRDSFVPQRWLPILHNSPSYYYVGWSDAFIYIDVINNCRLWRLRRRIGVGRRRRRRWTLANWLQFLGRGWYNWRFN